MRKSHSPILLFRVCTVTLVLALCMFPLAGSTNANLVTFTLEDSADQTEDGQNFDFTFFPAAASDGNNATLTIRARGDYSLDNADEFLTWDIEGIASGKASPTLGKVVNDVGPSQVEWTDTFTINANKMREITADNQIEISIDLAPAVSVHSWRDEFVEVKLAYVPEPATLFLLGAGSLLFLRRRRHKA